MTRIDLDRLDWEILRELAHNSRQSLRKIARKLGVSVNTVSSRIKELEKKGIIKKYTIVIDYEKLGFDLTAIIEVSILKGKLIDVENEIAKLPGVCAVYDVTGLTDAMIIARVKNRRELNSLVKTILKMDYVDKTNTHVVLNTVKESFESVL
ncbi:MAG: AsnC family transcriptional regulator [Thermoprotei archaeon]|nr:MAG: AsnC family transcriptional regulator [Thermoprotei archaeon]